MAINTFIKGSTVYTCTCCGIQTRKVSNSGALSCELCEECYELAGIENELQDGGEVTPNMLAQIDQMLAIIAKKGGDTTAAFDKSLLTR